MAVPKKKTSRSKRGMRRAGKSLKPKSFFINEMGEVCISHRVSPGGNYKGKKIIV